MWFPYINIYIYTLNKGKPNGVVLRAGRVGGTHTIGPELRLFPFSLAMYAFVLRI